jgi:hypothetical protein
MKALLLLIMTIGFASVTVGAANAAPISVVDSELGSFQIELANARHPVLLPYRLSVMVLCKDRRVPAKMPKPKVELIFGPEAVCRYHANNYVIHHKYDSTKKELIVEYYVSTTMEGEGKCDTKMEQPFYLDQLCSEYR